MATFNLIANENSAAQSCPKNTDDQNRNGVSGAGSENTNSLLNLLNYQPDIDDNFFCKRSSLSKISIANQWTNKCKTFWRLPGFYQISEPYEWCLSK